MESRKYPYSGLTADLLFRAQSGQFGNLQPDPFLPSPSRVVVCSPNRGNLTQFTRKKSMPSILSRMLWSPVKDRIKSRVCHGMGICYNPYGVPFELAKYIKDKKHLSIIDIGAFEGGFAESIERMCGLERAILIEPQPDLATKLRKNFSGGKYSVIEAAVGDREGVIEFQINATNATSSILECRRDMPELESVNVSLTKRAQCKLVTLDSVDLIERNRPWDLVKIDVQGAEHLVIKGGLVALAHTRLMWVEVSFKRLYESACLFGEIYDLLNSAGFSLKELAGGFRGPTGELLQADALFEKRP